MYKEYRDNFYNRILLEGVFKMGKILEILALFSTGRWRPVSPEEDAMDSHIITVPEEAKGKPRKTRPLRLKDFLQFKV